MGIALGISLIITGLIYRVTPVWKTLNWGLTAIAVGILQILILIIIKGNIELIIDGCLLIGLGSLLPDLGNSISGWFRRPQTTTLILKILAIGIIIFIFANPELLNSIIGPLMGLVIMISVFNYLKKSLFK